MSLKELKELILTVLPDGVGNRLRFVRPDVKTTIDN